MSKHLLGFGIACLVVLCAAGCGNGDGTEPVSIASTKLDTDTYEQFDLTLQFPAGKSSSDFALIATSSLVLNDRVKVRTSAGAPAGVWSSGTSTTEVGASASTGDVYSKGSAWLRSYAAVTGPLFTEGTYTYQDGASVSGGVHEHATLTPYSLSKLSVAFPTTMTGATPSLEPDQVVPPSTQPPLSAGRYGDVVIKSRATLRLKTGSYFFDSLMVEPDGILQVDNRGGTVVIYLKNWMTHRGKIVDLQANPTSAAVVSVGTGDILFEVPFTGVVLAPSGNVTLAASNMAYWGTFVGRNVLVRPDVTVYHSQVSIGTTPGEGTTSDPPPRTLPVPALSPVSGCGDRRGLAVGPWAMLGACPAHLGLSSFVGTRDNHLNWVATTNGAVRAQPAIQSDGTIYVGSTDGSLYALQTGGLIRWSYGTGSVIESSPALAKGGKIIVGTNSGHVLAVSEAGNLTWDFDSTPYVGGIASAIRSSPVIDGDGAIYVGSDSGRLIAITQAGGLKWVKNLGGSIDSSPALGSDGYLYIGTATGIARVSRVDGAVTWTNTSAGPIQSAPMSLPSGDVIATGAAGVVSAVRRADGTTRWSTSIGSGHLTSPAVSPLGIIVVGSEDGNVYGLDANGLLLWTYSTGRPVRSTPAVEAGGLAYIGSSSGTVTAIETRNGAVAWQFAANSAVDGPPAVASNGAVIVGGSDGTVYSIGKDPTLRSTTEVVGSGCPAAGAVTSLFGLGLNASLGVFPGAAQAFGIVDGCIGLVPIVRQTMPDGVAPPYDQSDEKCAGDNNNSTKAGLRLSADGKSIETTTPVSGCLTQFCDENENVRTDIDLARLNAAVAGTCPNTFPPADAENRGPANCPILTNDPAHPLGGSCATNLPGCVSGEDCRKPDSSLCASGQVCAVACTDPGCTSSDFKCGTPAPTCGDLPDAPASPPCEEIRVCADTGNMVSYTGESWPSKTDSKSLRENVEPAPEIITDNQLPLAFPRIQDQNPCELLDADGGDETQVDPRGADSGNDKWGIFIEPNVSHDLLFTPKPLDQGTVLNMSAKGSFKAGVYLWGKRRTVLDVGASVQLDTCGFSAARTIKFLGQSQTTDDGRPNASTDSTKRGNCLSNYNSYLRAAGDLKKALFDAKAVKDYIAKNGVTTELCNRTKSVYGNYESGCTAAAEAKWVGTYEKELANASAAISGSSEMLSSLTAKDELEVGIAETQFDVLGASFSYPVGPITIDIEIDISGRWGIAGLLDYEYQWTGEDGPKLKAGGGVKPELAVWAFAYAGAGIGPFSVGLAGDLLLIKLGAPLTSSISLGRTMRTDTRPLESSGFFANSAQAPAFPVRAQNVVANWSYGAGVELESLKGQLDLAARINLWFTTKTFRRKLASWNGFKKTYNFVGRANDPIKSQRNYGTYEENTPYPQLVDFSALPGDAGEPSVDLATLGPKSMPGICGNPPSCTTVNNPCGNGTGGVTCCNPSSGLQCVPNPSNPAVNVCLYPPPILL